MIKPDNIFEHNLGYIQETVNNVNDELFFRLVTTKL